MRIFKHTMELRRLTPSERNFRALRKNAEVLDRVVQNARDGIVIHDLFGRIEWVNDAYIAMSGYDIDEIIGKRPQSFMVPPDKRPSDEDLERFVFDIGQEKLNSYELIQNVRKNGDLFWNSLSFGVVPGRRYEDTKVVIICRDVTDQIEREKALEQSNQRAEFQADHDELTGLANRTKLVRELAVAHQNFLENGKPYGVMHLDLDKFKSVNDTLGHAAGDAVLVNAARKMRNHVRGGDTLCRVGGDEFVVICYEIGGFEAMQNVARRLIEDLSRPISWQGTQIKIGASIGIAMANEALPDGEAVIRNADIALYEVKNNGRNGFACYDESLGRAHLKDQRLTAELTDAIDNREFGIVIQPQYSLIARAVTGFETLLRWHHPKRGLLFPDAFMDLAIRNGLMSRLDKISVAESLRALREIHDAGFPGMVVSINASATSLLDNDYLEYLKWQVDLHNIAPESVVIEILETTFFSDGEKRAEKTIKNISNAGFRVELDDFGTGFAGLAHLAHLEIDGVKIDRSMVHDLHQNTTSQIIVEATVGLGRDLGLHVIAEGVENRAQAELLREFGCANVQGFGIAPPMSQEDALAWLKTTDMSLLPLDYDQTEQDPNAQLEPTG